MGWIDSCHCEKFRCNFVEPTFALVAPVHPVLYRASCSNKTIQNASKHNKTHQNMSLGPNGVDRVHSLRKILMRLCGKNFCINCTISAQFAPSFIGQRNSPKSIQTVRNIRKHDFRIQWVASGAFVAKNYDMISWHELLH